MFGLWWAVLVVLWSLGLVLELAFNAWVEGSGSVRGCHCWVGLAHSRMFPFGDGVGGFRNTIDKDGDVAWWLRAGNALRRNASPSVTRLRAS